MLNLRVDILPRPGLGGIRVLGHVAGAAPTGCHHRRLEGGRLEVLGLELGRHGAVGHVAGAAATVGGESAHLREMKRGMYRVGR